MRRIALITIIAVAGLAPGSAWASVYWGTYAGNLGRANLDGTGMTPNLLTPRQAQNVCGIAVDRDWIYFAHRPISSIGRASLDGTLVTDSFISGLTTPCGVAVDAAHIYWADSHYGTDGAGTIGRTGLDGFGASTSFITGLDQPCAVAVDSAHIYWASCGTNDAFGTGTTIGRANLDGTGVEKAFITGANGAAGVAVDAAHLYWSNNTTGMIGRADLDGSHVDQSFIQASPGPAAGVGGPSTLGVAADAQHLYWDEGEGVPFGWAAFVGRASVAGTDVRRNFLVADSMARGIAVDPYSASATTLTAVPDALTFGDDVALRAHVGAVSPPAGAPVQPVGQVKVTVDRDAVGTGPVDAVGDARVTPPFFVDAGLHFAQADYTGDALYATSHGFARFTVNPAATRTELSLEPNPMTAGSRFHVALVVRNTSTDVIPFGSVEFLVAGDSLGWLELDDDGRITLDVLLSAQDLPPGQYPIVARYSDETGSVPDFLPSSAQATLTVKPTTVAAPPAVPTSPASVKQPTVPTFTLRAPKVKRGRITVTALAPAAGRIRARATTSGSQLYGSAQARARAAGPVTLALTPGRKAKRALVRAKRLRVTLTVSFTPAHGGSATTVVRSLSVSSH